MNIHIEGNATKPGDYIYVPMKVDGKVKPMKVRVAEVIVRMTADGFTVQNISAEGQTLPCETYEDPWICQQAIDIIENHRKQVEQELAELALKGKKEKTK